MLTAPPPLCPICSTGTRIMLVDSRRVFDCGAVFQGESIEKNCLAGSTIIASVIRHAKDVQTHVLEMPVSPSAPIRVVATFENVGGGQVGQLRTPLSVVRRGECLSLCFVDENGVHEVPMSIMRKVGT